MKTAVFGGTGFVGGYLVDALLDAGHSPSLLVRPGSEGKVRQPDRCERVRGDLSDSGAIRQTLNGCDAAMYNVGLLREFPRKGITFEEMHDKAAVRVMDEMRTSGIKRLLLMSAAGIHDKGTPYQVTKLAAERYALESGLDVTIFRPSVIFGDPRGTMEIATQLYQQMVRPPVPAVRFVAGGKDVMMSPAHIGDVASAFVRALPDAATYGKTFELGGPEALAWGEMIQRIAAATGRRKILMTMPIGLMKFGATLFDWLPFYPVTRDQLAMLAEGNVVDPGDLQRLIGKEPTAFTPEKLSYLRHN
jgi:NADH dehydrogenase